MNRISGFLLMRSACVRNLNFSCALLFISITVVDLLRDSFCVVFHVFHVFHCAYIKGMFVIVCLL